MVYVGLLSSSKKEINVVFRGKKLFLTAYFYITVSTSFNIQFFLCFNKMKLFYLLNVCS